MTDEEKKAIEYFNTETITEEMHYGAVLVKLIEKQSKEIEELKQEKEYLNCIIESDKDNYINKDKIKAKIEEYKKDGKIINQTMLYCGEYINHFEIKALQSLLEKE